MADTNIEAPKLPPQAGKEIGQSGTYMFSGFISGEEYNIDLQGKYGLQVYDTMRRSDPTVHAALIVCKNPIIGAKWDVEPASSDPNDVEAAEFVKRELFDRRIMFQDTIRELLTSLDFGHSVAEIVYETTEFNGKVRIGLKKIATRKQRSILKWEISGGKPGITQITPTAGLIEIPRNKLIYVTNEREGDNYEGISLLRFAYKPWKIKDSLEIMNAVALERMAIGVPVVTKGVGNENADEHELAKIRMALRQMRANEEAYIELPSSVSISMLDMKAQSTKDVMPTIEHQDKQITLSVLAQFLMLGQTGGSGSRAVSADHSALFVKSLEAVARTIQQPFQEDIINRLVDMNYSNLQNGYPKLIFSELSDDDVSLLSASVASLMTAGALSRDPNLENRLRNVLDLPEMSDDMYDNYGNEPIDTPAGGDVTKPKDILKEDKQLTDIPDGDKTTASIIADARAMQQKLIAHIFEN
jgi:phage gp29-like protein